MENPVDQSFVLDKAVQAPLERVFAAFTNPQDLQAWHHAGDWQTPYAEVDGREGGALKIAYADPEGVLQFELIGTIETYLPPRQLVYRMDDERLVHVQPEEHEGLTQVHMEIDAEPQTPLEYQRLGWMAHLDNLAAYLEAEGGPDA